MTMRVGDRVEVFNVYRALKLPAHYEELSMISVVESDATSLVAYMSPIDPVERGFKKFEALDRPVTLTLPRPSIEEAPKLEFKPLPAHLRYAYLGNSETLLVIISSILTSTQEEKLLRVLREHKKVIGWTIADIKDISPSFCMQKIFLEDGHHPSVEQQRRLNLIMKEVVKKEVIKFLDASIIFSISDSNWKAQQSNSQEPLPASIHRPNARQLAGHEYYCFLDGYSGYNQIVICLEDQEKTTFTCPYGIFAFKSMPFGLCNAPGTFQRCMMAIFTNMVERFAEVFMDDFSVFGFSYDDCLRNLSKVLASCEETNLVKCHFMVQEGTVLGQKVSRSGIGADKVKVEAVEKLPLPISVKGVRSFLGHTGFDRRFIKDFSKIATLLCRLLEKNVTFNFDDACLKAFEELNKKLVTAPIIVAPDWSLPFKLMCDASDLTIGAVLGQRKDKVFHSIYYTSKTLEDAQLNYTTTEKELLAVVWAFEKFGHTWVLPPEIESESRKRFLHDVNFYYWDEPYLYKQCADQLMRRCIPEKEVELVLYDSHASPYGGHHGGDRTAAKVLQSGLFLAILFKDAHALRSVTNVRERKQSQGGMRCL
ncbi:uncharacterized protein [Nicotiana sylvestris]|uniref:uncharacterized protein n=1 Tax=Nicotiana sylvestris TaxID=4096 RepID=UPI00388CB297